MCPLQRVLAPCLAIACGSTLVAHAQGPGLRPEAVSQIQAVAASKRARTAVERKMGSQLVYGLREARGRPAVPGAPSLRADLPVEPDGRVMLDMEAMVSADLMAAVASGGGEVLNHYAAYRAARVLVPLSLVETLAARPDVTGIRPANRAATRTGPVTSEGDITHAAAAARAAFGVDGSGVRIGVLSDSVDYLEVAQANGELPAVTVLPGQDGIPATGEGTAMLEIIHDLAPGAELYFATAFQSVAGFAQNILDLRAAGCDIIIDDVGYFNESPFQDAPIADAVNAVTADGVLYFASAGNAGNKNDNTSSTWEGDFVDAGPAGAPINQGVLHRFGATTYNRVLSVGSRQRVDLFWSDPLGGSANDYDLYVLDSSGAEVLRSSTSIQNGNDDPYESLSTLNVDEQIVIVKSSGEDRFLHLSAGRGRLSVSTPGEIRGHPAATDAYAVAAVRASTSYPDPFTGGVANPVETFSSDGPRRVFYQTDGTPITPGDFSSSGGTVRDKPDLAAADGVRTSNPSFNPFYGTSAAAPHAAAIAGLLLSYSPMLTPQETRTLLTGTALDVEAPGPDRDSGAGLVMADALLQAAPGPSPYVVAVEGLLVGETCVSTNGLADPGEIVTAEFRLANLGNAATSNLVASVLATNGVIPLSAPVAYGVLDTHGTVAAGAFTFLAEGACGDAFGVLVGLSDGADDLGTLAFPFALGSIGEASAGFTNGAAVKVPANGNSGIGSPYPSTIDVSGVNGAIIKVAVTLHDVAHAFPDDLDILLVGPSGDAVTLMSDVGGGHGLSGVTLTFDPDAASALPDESLVAPGTYRPSNYGGDDTFPAPAPGGIHGTDLSVFVGLEPNGTWSLFTVDDAVPNKGNLSGGWSLSIVTEGDPGCCTYTDVADMGLAISPPAGPVTAGSPQSFVLQVTNTTAGAVEPVIAVLELPGNIAVTATSASQGTVGGYPGSVVWELGTVSTGAWLSVAATSPLAGAFTGSAFVAAAVLDPNAGNDRAEVTLSWQAAPVIGPSDDVVGLEDGPIDPMVLDVSDAETATGDLVLTAASANQALLPEENVVFTFDGTNHTVSLRPETNGFGESLVTLVVRDGDGASASNAFLLTVLPVNDGPSLDAMSNLSVSATAGVQVVALTGIGSGADNEVQGLSVSAFTESPLLVTNVMVTYTSPAAGGSLFFTPVPATSGEAGMVVVVEDDGGTADGGVNTMTQQFAVSVLAVYDTDGDLLPDVFELENELDPLDPADAQADPDEDGMVTLDEFYAGTDPNDGGDVLKLVDMHILTNGVGLVFQSVSGKTYALEHAVVPASTNGWTDAGTTLTSTGEVTAAVDTNQASSLRSYRIRLQP